MADSKVVMRKEMPTELVGLQPSGSYTFDELYRLAQVCHASGMFRDTADAAQAMMKILRGQEIGLTPTTAMSAFDIIKDRLFIKPWAIAAKINSCGYGTYRVLTQTDQECSILFRRKYAGEGWRDLPPVGYTIVEAKAHGLLERSPHWKASPGHMLYQRAMGRGGAMYFPELLAGLEAPPDDANIPMDRHQQNIRDLYGDIHGSPNAPNFARDAGKVETSTNARSPETSRVSEPAVVAASGQKTPPPQEPSWKMTLRAHRETIAGMAEEESVYGEDALERLGALVENIDFALSPLGTTTDAQGYELASAVLEWVGVAKEG